MGTLYYGNSLDILRRSVRNETVDSANINRVYVPYFRRSWVISIDNKG